MGYSTTAGFLTSYEIDLNLLSLAELVLVDLAALFCLATYSSFY